MLQHILPFSLDPLDKNFVPAKPKHSVEDRKVYELEQQGDLIITRKRDGYRHLVVVSSSRVRIYTRGIEDVTALYPHICEDFLRLGLPTGDFLFDGEMLVDNSGRDEFEMLTRIAKSKPEAAIALQSEAGKAVYMIFDPIIWEGRITSDKPYRERLCMLKSLFGGHQNSSHVSSISPVPVLSCSFNEARKQVLREGWEGLVLYDGTKPTAFRLDGRKDQPIRPDGCWKWKPHFEDDFIATRFTYGTGKNKDRMGKLYLAQIDPQTGEMVSCGEVGGGFSDAEREDFAHATYPLVVQVEYQRRFPSGALRHPQFVRLRGDKAPEECIYPTS